MTSRPRISDLMQPRIIAVAIVATLAVVAAGLAVANGSMPFANSDVAAQPALDDPTLEPEPDLTASPDDEPTEDASPTETETEASPEPTETETELSEEEKAAIEAERAQVVAVQTKLTELRYYAGPVDGDAGPKTSMAVMAFQKVNRLGADGVIGPKTLAALDAPVSPSLKGGNADRIEVDLTLQVAYAVKGGSLVRILPISSGSGETYRTASGGTAVSLTPVGDFKIQRRIVGERKAPLGILYDPLYIYKGWALHGSNHVPAYPASHGCIRLTRWDAVWLAGQYRNGTQVRLYGGTHTFTMGSSAPGTDEPGGDTGPGAEGEDPSTSPSPSPSPSPQPSPSPSPSPQPAPSDPEPSEPEPTQSEPSDPPSEPEPTPSESTEPDDDGIVPTP